LGLVFLVDYLLPPEKDKVVESLLDMLWWINLFWPILNLLPIWPLDGGQITREVCQMIWKQNGVSYSLLISCGVAGVLALHCLMSSQGKPLIPFLPRFGLFTAIFMAMFALQSFQAFQIESNRRPSGRNDRLPWE